ncbi:MAG TPA: PHP domain-containing protein [Candidatus Saccharimonadales bacterium]|nr:PHP domain-containing protein [Candidatus Saccharimonadales bacterium]
MSFKIDLHTHSVLSPDGAITADHYRAMLKSRRLDCIAVTDHNSIDLALRLREELGAKIIVGEEITTKVGEVVGLFLSKTVPPNLGLAETVEHIREQGGVVYIPHPFETVRKGISEDDLTSIADEVDIMEVHNGRAIFQNRSIDAQAWADLHSVPGVASSDSHGFVGWGKTYTEVSEMPTVDNIVNVLKNAEYHYASPGLSGILYPKFNRLRKKWRHHA